ncbi:MAG TPA: FG-GAP-like repeat-containing protein [Opitutus sp.]|nr:FG-GAP-like repeat-containing protein [Opitutus sp.]
MNRLWPCALLVALAVGATPAGAAHNIHDADTIHRMNIGKAELENGAYAAAIVTFREALETSPDNVVALRNLARAHLFNEEFATALSVLAQARELETHPATFYLTALAHLRLQQPAAAVAPLENAVRLDDSTAALRFQLAKTYEALGRERDALVQYRETARLDPQHAAAHFELAMYARNMRDLETYRAELRIYKRLRDAFGDPDTSPLILEACVHTRAEAPLPVSALAAQVETALPRSPVRMVEQTAAVIPNPRDREAVAIAPLACAADGRMTFVALSSGGALRVLAMNESGTLEAIGEEMPLPSIGADAVIRVGHFHDSVASQDRLKEDLKHFADVLVAGRTGVRLLERTDATTFVDVTEKSGLTARQGNDACWSDYDHDGDLDLLIAADTGISLWQNRADGRFQEVAAEAQLVALDRAGSIGAADLDGNGGVDFIVASGGQPTLIHENQRAGRFRPRPEPPGPWPAARQVLIEDIDNDGSPDVALVGDERTELKLGGGAQASAIEHRGFAIHTATFIDHDNDGWMDFCAAGVAREDAATTVLRLWRNLGKQGWSDVSEELLHAGWRIPASELVAIDVDADGDSDLLLVTSDGRLAVLRNKGGNAQRQLKLRLNSLAMANHGGIGATVEVRSGSTLISRVVSRELPVEIGLGDLQRLDSVQVVWPDGTVDNHIDVAADARVVSVHRRSAITTGSCPYLYAWDGSRFRFITDFLGSGALGLAVTRDLVWPPDPIEIVRIGNQEEFRPREGRYLVTLTSELREVDYFDALELMAVDHPAETEVHPTDSFMPPPVTPSALWAMSDAIPLINARDSENRDVTESLSQIDGRFALPGEILLPPLRGVCRPIDYTLDFGPLPVNDALVLAVTGRLEFGTASSNIALSQTDAASLIWPTLEADSGDGRWQPVAVNIGIPDGRTKTHACDLTGKLPAGARRLRLTTSFQIYWDRIALLRKRELPPSRMHVRPFDRANLRWRGFSALETAADGSLRVPTFDNVTDQPSWRTTLEGWCTRYGETGELIARTDGMLAVLNGGDALELELRADALPPVPEGFTRTFFLSAVGWDKEENNNTIAGNTVEPLPGQLPVATDADALERPEWTQRYNTRWVPRNRFRPGMDERRSSPSPAPDGWVSANQ